MADEKLMAASTMTPSQNDEVQEDEFQKIWAKIRKESRLKSLMDASLIGERYRKVSFSNTEIVNDAFGRTLNRCIKYCEISEDALVNGYGMYIFGETTGAGKTHLTACMCNDLLRQYKPCMFTNFQEISKQIRATFNSKDTSTEVVIKKICDVDFLFIDDIGIEILKKNGEDTWLQGQMYDIINARYINKKPTIFTSNFSLNELISKRGFWKRTVDRIAEMSTAIIKLEGESYRLKNKPKAPF